MSDQKQEFKRYEYHHDNIHKFWEIWKNSDFDLNGVEYYCYTTRWGKIGNNGTQRMKTYYDIYSRNQTYYRKISEKLRKGYTQEPTTTSKHNTHTLVTIDSKMQYTIKDPNKPLTLQDLEILHQYGVKQNLVVEATVELGVLLQHWGWHWRDGHKIIEHAFPSDDSHFYELFPLKKSVVKWFGRPPADAYSTECNRIDITVDTDILDQKLRESVSELEQYSKQKRLDEAKEKVNKTDSLFNRLDSMEFEDD